jgi:hypothetical protein
MKILKFVLIFIIFSNNKNISAIEISNYQSCFGICNLKDDTGSFRIYLRKFVMDASEYLFTLDPHNLNTFLEKTSSLKKIEASTLTEIRKNYSNSKYIKALVSSEKRAAFLQNAGFTHFPQIKNGVILTADLCPSKLPIDKYFFKTIIDEFIKIQKTAPIALCVTGVWLENHMEDLKWLKTLEEKSLLSITWINHSYNHKFRKDLPLVNNFLLLTDANIENEVLDTEKKMLESGIMPSVFFRFPGLVSNRELFLKITGYGLIPIGSDAWLAKDERPKNGSIILVHANGNEPEGIIRLKELVQKERKNTINKRWILYDIKESMAE